MYRIVKIQKVSASSAAQDVKIGYRPFLIQNTDSDPIYFKEKGSAAATADNGFALAAGQTLETVLTADVLSVYGGTANILLLEEG